MVNAASQNLNPPNWPQPHNKTQPPVWSVSDRRVALLDRPRTCHVPCLQRDLLARARVSRGICSHVLVSLDGSVQGRCLSEAAYRAPTAGPLSHEHCSRDTSREHRNPPDI